MLTLSTFTVHSSCISHNLHKMSACSLMGTSGKPLQPAVCGPVLFLSPQPLSLIKRPTSFLCRRADKDDEAEQPDCAARAALSESLSHLP